MTVRAGGVVAAGRIVTEFELRIWTQFLPGLRPFLTVRARQCAIRQKQIDSWLLLLSQLQRFGATRAFEHRISAAAQSFGYQFPDAGFTFYHQDCLASPHLG